jgi:SAM-dependent methyltransferase
VVDVGAGYCSFINAVVARRRVAIDLNTAVGDFAAPGVETIVGSATDIGHLIPAGEFDMAFSSNLLEHLSHEQIGDVLDGCSTVLRPGGRLILMGPNFRLCAKRYWDDYTHVTALSDVSLSDFVASRGFRVVRVEPRFMPFSLKTRFARLSGLTPLYLRSPIRPLAGQMLVVAEKVANV